MKNTAVARPYAKAAFEFALEHNELTVWSDFLTAVALLTEDDKVMAMLGDPNVGAEQLFGLYSLENSKLGNEHTKNFLHIVIEAQRLIVMPEIHEIYEQYRREHEQTIVADVTAFSELSQDQQDKIKQSLKERLGQTVNLQYQVDKSILGGAIIRAGDLVIDGSVRGQLEKLRQQAAE